MLPERIYFGEPTFRRSEKDGISETLSFNGVLYLTKDPQKFRAQIATKNFDIASREELLNDLSTDSILRVVDLLTDNIEQLGQKVLLGLTPEYGIEEGTIMKSERKVLVAGERFGRGSSREQAVWALQKAGIHAVIAPSFGSIFEKNAAYLGLLTSTNFDLLDSIKKEETVPFNEFLEDKDPLLQNIIKNGGLFNYLKRIKEGQLPPPLINRRKDPIVGMNIIEQRLAKAFGSEQVLAEDSSLLPIDLAYSYVGLSGLARYSILSAYGYIKRSLDADKIFLFEDHFAHSEREAIPQLTINQRIFADELEIPDNNYYRGKRVEGGGAGITHRVMLEKLDPRVSKVVVATDSHTPTIGALPLAALPVGSTLFAAAIAEGKIPYSVGSTLRVELSGSLPPGVTIRDAQLELAATVKPINQGFVIEYGGAGLNSLTFEQVAALCNMVPEVFNAEVAVTEAFDSGIKYLQDKFNISKQYAFELYGMPEENCEYAQVVYYDLNRTTPWIARPNSPNNAVSLASLEKRPEIDKAFLVSCLLGLQDLKEAAATIQGKKVSEKTQLIIIPSSDNVRKQAEEIGLVNIFENAGASVVNESACGPCIGEGLGAVTDAEVAITASNRNFPGRMGSRTASVYMGGAILTTLSAIYGRIPTADEYRSEIGRITENLKNWQ